jgi:hypothetical protein
MVLWLVYSLICHWFQQWEGSGITAWYKRVAGVAFVMGLDMGHGRGCRVQQV